VTRDHFEGGVHNVVVHDLDQLGQPKVAGDR